MSGVGIVVLFSVADGEAFQPVLQFTVCVIFFSFFTSSLSVPSDGWCRLVSGEDYSWSG